MPYFPARPIDWRLEEPPAMRRLSLSLVGMAVLTGVVVRLIRVGGLTLAGAEDWWLIILTLTLSGVLVAVLATAHLGNFPVNQWIWRAPLFGTIAGFTEGALSGVLIAARLERIGSEQAVWNDWPSLVVNAVLRDIIIVTMFALVLAAVVQVVRRVVQAERR